MPGSTLRYTYNFKFPFTVGQNVLNKISELENNMKNYDIQIEDLKIQKHKYIEQSKKMPLKQLEHLRLVKNVETTSNIYLRLLQREEELKIIEAKELGGITLIDKAKDAYVTNPEKPKSTIIILGFLLGIILGISTALLKEYLDTTFKSPNDIMTILGLKILGLIPMIESENYEHNLESKFNENLVTYYNPKIPSAEAFRTLRVVIDLLSNNDESTVKEGKSILITSPNPNEGKSLIVANIAISLASINKKVILVDTDTRKPTINKLFNVAQTPGLTDIVFRNQDYRNTIIHGIVPDLDILTSGDKTTTEIEFTNSKNFVELYNKLKKEYDYIIFDSPALLVVSDPIMLSTMMDIVIMVIRHNTTKYDFALKALRNLENIKAKVKGVIYNGVTVERKYYYKYYEK